MKLGSASCSDGAASHNTVFIDTSLDTRLAMVVLDGDTVSDLKEKIEKEHPLCFPHVGNIKIHALKVKRKGYFYHLSESMYLKSAFVGVNKSWFLSIDASSVDDHSTDPNTGNLSTYFGMANNTSVDELNLASNSQPGQMSNHDAPSLRDNVVQQYVNEKAPGDIRFGSCHSSKKDLIIKKAEVTHSVENCSKVQLSWKGNGCEDHNEPLESLPAVNVNHKSKKRKTKLMNEHALEVDNYFIDDNGQNSLQQDIGSREKLRDYACKEDSDLPMMESKSNANEPSRSSSSNAHNESEYGLKGTCNLSEETEVPGELDGKNDKSKNAFPPTHNSSLETAQAGPTAKEMYKIEQINGVKGGPEGNRGLVSDSNKVTSKPEVTSNYLAENKQIAKVVLDGLSAEPDVYLLETGSSNAKRKKKKRQAKFSDNPNQAIGLISSRAGAQDDASRESDVTTVPSHDVEDPSISKLLGISEREKHDDSNLRVAENFALSPVGGSHVNMKNADLDVQSLGDASDKVALGVKGTTDSKGSAFISNNPTNLQKSICTNEDANCVQSNQLNCQSGQAVVIPEERDSMQNVDTKATMVENCHSSSWDGADMNMKATQISESPHLKGNAKSIKCSKKKKTRKPKDSAGGTQVNLVTTSAKDFAHGVPSTELHGDDGNNSSSKAEIGESNISLVKGENIVNASSLPADRNIDMDETNRSKVEPLLQINKTQAGAQNMDKQVSKRLKKRPLTSMKSRSDLHSKSVGNEDSSPSKRSNKEVKTVSKTAKKTKLPKVKSRNEIEGANLDSMRLSEVESSPPSIHMKSRIVRSSLIPFHASEGNHEEGSLEANMYGNTSKDGTADNVDNHVEVSCESNKVDIEETTGQFQHESVEAHIDKLSRDKGANTLLKAKRKKKDLNACSSEASLSLQDLEKSDENTDTGRHCQTSNSSSLKLQGLSSKDKCDETLHSDKKVNKISGDGVKSLLSNEQEQYMPNSDKARVRVNAVDTSGNSAEKNSEAFAVPRMKSNLKNSKSMVHQDKKHMGRQSTPVGHPMGGRKSSRNGNRDVTRSGRKNLLATSGGIFKDASSDSSEDKDRIADSDASTRSPDNSLSSDFSDGESNANMNSSGNGSIDLERKNIRGRSIRKKGLSSPQNMTLDTILRSSRRYKKAKLTAAQSQLEDTESKPINFVPDSQPNL